MRVGKYNEVVETLKREIREAKYSEGSFPSVVRVMRRFRISRATAVRVLDELKRRNLVRSRQGRGTFVVDNVPGKIGLILAGVSNPEFFQPIVAVIVSAVKARGWELVFGNLEARTPQALLQKTRAFAKEQVEKGVAGVIYHPVGFPGDDIANREILDVFGDASIPVVLLGRDIDRPPARSAYDLVCIDNFDAGYRLAKHMIECGARRICFLKRAGSGSAVMNRLAGAQAAVRETGRRCRCMTHESALSEVAALKGRIAREHPDAFICGNDGIAPQMRRLLEKLRLNVPDDVQLAAFDDTQLVALQTPALTTIHQPCAEIGAAVVDRMLARLENRDGPACEIRLKAELSVRESTRDWKSRKPAQGKGKRR